MARLRAQAGKKERPPGMNKGTALTEEELSMTNTLTRRGLLQDETMMEELRSALTTFICMCRTFR